MVDIRAAGEDEASWILAFPDLEDEFDEAFANSAAIEIEMLNIFFLFLVLISSIWILLSKQLLKRVR